MVSIVLPALTVLLIAGLDRLWTFLEGRRKTRYLPGLRSAFTPVSPLGAILPTSRFNPGYNWQWLWRNQVYHRYGSETISLLPYLFGRPALYTSSMEVARQVVSTRGQFIKPDDYSLIFTLWGENLFSANGSEWKRHRRIVAPAFGRQTYALVWKETSSIYQEMLEAENWDASATHTIPSINKLTTKLALVVISRCGFGNRIPWKFSESSTPGAMSFAEALLIVSTTVLIRLIVPKWMYYLPIKRLQNIETAYRSLAAFSQSLIQSRRQELAAGEKTDRNDLFSLMIRASEEDTEYAMSDDELRGNTFLMLLAGHESTAHALDATMGFLALYDNIQDEVYEHIMEVTSGNHPGFDDSSRLFKVEACFLEAARLFPAGAMVFRDTAEDVVLTIYNQDGETEQLPLESGLRVAIDFVGIHYNPRHFPDPEEFRPSRWYGANENDLSMFSLGSRSCIGKRFAITEAVCFLTMILRDWKLDIILKDGETRPQWRERVMRGYMTMTLGVGDVPLRLTRRT